jgi:uncharacterized protein (TIGR00290 family)
VIALSWSGGKDSALALRELRRAGAGVDVLLTTFDEASGRIPHHGVGIELVRAQAASVGLPLLEVAIPPGAANAVYEERLRAALAAGGVRAVAFGDLFLADLRSYRETRLAEAGVAAHFPLWGRDTGALAREFVDAGFRATVVSALDRSLLGRAFDHELLDGLPAGVDPCGENGELHTFVWSGPVFSRPLAVAPGAVVEVHGFAQQDLVLSG